MHISPFNKIIADSKNGNNNDSIEGQGNNCEKVMQPDVQRARMRQDVNKSLKLRRQHKLPSIIKLSHATFIQITLHLVLMYAILTPCHSQLDIGKLI